MKNAIRSLLAQPRVPDPPVRVWRDWVLVGLLIPLAIVEAIAGEDVTWRPLALAITIGLIIALFWRRTHPLTVVAIAFGVAAAANIANILAGAEDYGLYASAFMAVLPYSLLRWASGRDVAKGTAIIVIASAINIASAGIAGSSGQIVIDTLVGITLFLLLTAAAGALVRYDANARITEIDTTKLLEREQLARELHDSVAHHVSAIVIQAQAGRTVAASDPQSAASALEVIEEEASRTLAEMRLMVGALRNEQAAERGPRRGTADIERLARGGGHGLTVDVESSGDLGDLVPSVDTGIYRLAQESITNAARHASNASRVSVVVAADDTDVRLTVTDDGDPGNARTTASGYGLVGMKERATLLGGTLDAGPGGHEGWIVRAVIPKDGVAD